jgi:hypothetical protein
MPIDEQVTDFIAVRLTGGGAVESSREDAFFKYEYATHKGTITSASL